MGSKQLFFDCVSNWKIWVLFIVGVAGFSVPNSFTHLYELNLDKTKETGFVEAVQLGLEQRYKLVLFRWMLVEFFVTAAIGCYFIVTESKRIGSPLGLLLVLATYFAAAAGAFPWTFGIWIIYYLWQNQSDYTPKEMITLSELRYKVDFVRGVLYIVFAFLIITLMALPPVQDVHTFWKALSYIFLIPVPLGLLPFYFGLRPVDFLPMHNYVLNTFKVAMALGGLIVIGYRLNFLIEIGLDANRVISEALDGDTYPLLGTIVADYGITLIACLLLVIVDNRFPISGLEKLKYCLFILLFSSFGFPWYLYKRELFIHSNQL